MDYIKITMKKFNESPDVIKQREDNDSPTYGDDDSITFTLFNNFYLYSLWTQCTHGHLYEYLQFAIEGDESLAPDFWKIKYGGELSEEEKNKVKNLHRLDRTPVLKSMPSVIQGRLWTDSQVVSFWNDLVYIASRKNDIIEFIKIIKGDPKKYRYEIKDKLYSYDQFLSGKYNDDTKFDPTTVHTLSPEKKGEVLKSMGVVPKRPVPLAFKQMIQGESFRSWLEKGEK
jgi:hypothetical protein